MGLAAGEVERTTECANKEFGTAGGTNKPPTGPIPASLRDVPGHGGDNAKASKPCPTTDSAKKDDDPASVVPKGVGAVVAVVTNGNVVFTVVFIGSLYYTIRSQQCIQNVFDMPVK